MGACTVLFFALVASTSSLSLDSEDDKNRPVSKVITLLKDMQKTLQEEAKADEEVYDELACWCETNDKEKTKAIADAEAKIKNLNIAIEELTAESTRLQGEIETLEEEVKKNQAALAKATALRMKAQEEFSQEEKDLLQSVSALKAAIVVLSKHHPSLLQSSHDGKLNQVSNVLMREMQRHGALLQGVLTTSQRKTIKAFVQAVPAYAPQSGQVLGILKQMMETFESNLSQSQKDELAASSDYENLKAAKEHEIEAALNQIEVKTQDLATTDEKLAQAKTDLEDTTNSLTADQKFLMNLKEQCALIDSEWEERQKTRNMEIEAISKALEFLSSDEAHDLFTRTFNFAQKSLTRNTQVSRRRELASKLLKKVAQKTKNPKLMTLSLSIRLDAFTKVKAAIDEMIAQLTKEQSDEVKMKDYCVESLNVNERNTAKKNRNKASLEETVDDLTMTIDDLASSIKTLKAEISEMQFQLKRAGEDREKENKEFQETVADQRATQKLLKQALEILKGFYEKKASFLQNTGKQTPPTSFKNYKKNESSGGVMSMIQQIINDAKAAEGEAIRAEADSQRTYETFVKDTNASTDEKTAEIIRQSEAKGKAEVEKTKTEEELESVKADLDGLSTESADLHSQCDFLLKNFEIRQTARDQEIEALKQVKQILSGAKFAQFLQSDKFFDSTDSVSEPMVGSSGAQQQLQFEDDGGDPLQEFLGGEEQ
jgi:chromosome segregation ATPase